jgi:hypothetical protein
MHAPVTIDEILAAIPTLDRTDLRRLARASQRHLLEPRVPVATLERDALAAAGEETAARVEDDRRRARSLLAARLVDFKELRADHTYKTAVNAAIDAVVLGVHAREHLGAAAADGLVAAWIEATADRPGAERPPLGS